MQPFTARSIVNRGRLLHYSAIWNANVREQARNRTSASLRKENRGQDDVLHLGRDRWFLALDDDLP